MNKINSKELLINTLFHNRFGQPAALAEGRLFGLWKQWNDSLALIVLRRRLSGSPDDLNRVRCGSLK